VIVKDSGDNDADVSKRTEQLRHAYAEAKKKEDKDFILSRIASLSGGIGVIYVGGNTDLEQKELYDRVDDAVCAVRSALEEGILPGGGTALLWARKCLRTQANDSENKRIAYAILREALMTPLEQILINADYRVDQVYGEEIVFGQGYNVKTGEHGDMMKMGVIDPMKVVRTSLENAVSVAITIMSTNAIITMAREER